MTAPSIPGHNILNSQNSRRIHLIASNRSRSNNRTLAVIVEPHEVAHKVAYIRLLKSNSGKAGIERRRRVANSLLQLRGEPRCELFDLSKCIRIFRNGFNDIAACDVKVPVAAAVLFLPCLDVT